MYYAAAAICLTLVVLALIGKPIRIEIIHTVTPPPMTPEMVQKQAEDVKSKQAALDALVYMNETFHNVEVGDNNGTAKV